MQGITEREYKIKQLRVDSMLQNLKLDGYETKKIKELQEELRVKYQQYHKLLKDVQNCIKEYEEISKKFRPEYNRIRRKKK